MSDLEIHRFAPDDADDVRASFEISNAVAAADSPWEHPWLRRPVRHCSSARAGTASRRCATSRAWTASPVGDAFVFYSERDNTPPRLAVAGDPARAAPSAATAAALFERWSRRSGRAGRTSVGTDGWESERALGLRGAARAREEVAGDHAAPAPGRARARPAAGAVRRGGRPPRPTTSWSGSSGGRTPETGRRDGRAGVGDQRRPDRRPRHRGRGVLTRSGWPPTRSGHVARGSRLYRLVARHTGDRRARRPHRDRGRGAAAGDRRPARHGRGEGAPGAPARACCSRPGCCSGWPRPSPRWRPSTRGTPSRTTT